MSDTEIADTDDESPSSATHSDVKLNRNQSAACKHGAAFFPLFSFFLPSSPKRISSF